MDQGLSKKQGEGRKTFYNLSCCFIDTPNLKHLSLFTWSMESNVHHITKIMWQQILLTGPWSANYVS